MSAQDMISVIQQTLARTGEPESLILGQLRSLEDDRALAFKDGAITYVVGSPVFWKRLDTRPTSSPTEPQLAAPFFGLKIHDLDRDTSAFERIMHVLADVVGDRL